MRRGKINREKVYAYKHIVKTIMIMDDYVLAKDIYLIVDKKINECLHEHRRSIKPSLKVDFIPLTERDFLNTSYILGRLNKQMDCFIRLENMDKR